MEGRLAMACALILFTVTATVHSDTVRHMPAMEKTTHLHFFFHDTIDGSRPSAVMVAGANRTHSGKDPSPPFGSVFVIDDLLTEGPDPASKVIGNARGMYVSSSLDSVTELVVYADYDFTTGKFNGSSFSVLSRNPVTQQHRELAVVGGRGKFRMARGYAMLKLYSFNVTSGDAIVEYKVTLFHH